MRVTHAFGAETYTMLYIASAAFVREALYRVRVEDLGDREVRIAAQDYAPTMKAVVATNPDVFARGCGRMPRVL
jgi:hypothetical protein